MSHRNEIDIHYNKLSGHLLQFSYESIPVNKKTSSSYIIPGFNDYVKDLHLEEFWKRVKSSKRNYVHLSSKVTDCKVNGNSITDMSKTHFSILLSSVSDNTNKLMLNTFY